MSKKRIKKMFLLDGSGAILSAFLLGIVLVQFNHLFGIPKHVLYLLASLPCFFALYDFYCYLKIEQNLDKYLRVIAIVNILYCALSLGLALFHFKKITHIGWFYIIAEIIIVLLLATFEMRLANLTTKNEFDQD